MPNSRSDVKTIQTALGKHLSDIGYVSIKLDGIFGKETLGAIRLYQARVVSLADPDGIVDPDGPTICALNGVVPKRSSPPNLDSMPVLPVNPGAKPPSQPNYVQQFLTIAVPVAKELSRKYGIPASVILAQSSLESRWGRASSSYFGEKATDPRDKSITLLTTEFEKGKQVRVVANFKAYEGYAEAAKGFCEFLKRNPRYSKAFAHSKDGLAFVREISRAGYASDPVYEKKLINLIIANKLQEYDDK